MSQNIATLTMNPSVDTSCRVEAVVADRKLSCRDIRSEPGGGGINVARAIHHLGGQATAAFPAGGSMGEKLQALLDDEGVGYEVVATEAWTRENLIVADDANEQQYRFGMPGPKLSADEWEQCLETVGSIGDVRYLVASGSLPPGVPDDLYGRVARQAKERSVRFVLDTRGEPLKRGVEAGAFLLKPNMRELQQLVGRELVDEREQEQAAKELVENGACQILVLSLGAAGVLVVSENLCERVRSPSVPIRSKVGAGDSLVAGIVLGFGREMSTVEAVRFGVAASAAAVMTPGSQLCRREDTERLFDQMGAVTSSEGTR